MHALHRQEIAQERAIEQVNCQSAAPDIGPAHLFIAREQVRASDILAAPMGCNCKLADRGSVRQPQVQPLRANGRNNVGSFADQYDAFVCELSGSCNVKGKYGAPWLEFDVAENRMRCRLDLVGKLGIVECRELVCSGEVEDPDEACPVARQRYQRERASRGVKLS